MKLSTFNKVYFVSFAAINLIIYVAARRYGAYDLGMLTGNLLSIFIISWICSWCMWRASGKARRGGKLTFNIVLTLVILGMIVRAGANLNQARQINELQSHKEVFDKAISATHEPGEAQEAQEQLANATIETLDKMEKGARGQRKQVFKVLGELISDLQKHSQVWQGSYEAIYSPRMLDFARLTDDDEYSFQIEVVRTYLKATKDHKQFYGEMLPDLKRRLGNYMDDPFNRGVVEGFEASHLAGKEATDQLLDEHLNHGELLIELLELLRKNRQIWSYDNDQIVSSDRAFLREFDVKWEQIGQSEAAMEQLFETVQQSQSKTE